MMRGRTIFTTFALALLLIGCQKNLDNNSDLAFDKLNVNFGTSLADRPWSAGDEIGVYSSCTRNDEQHVSMSANANARYTARIVDDAVYFTNASEGDQVVATATDHNFKFRAYFPYADANTDMSALEVQVPAMQDYSRGVENYGFYVADEQVSTVVPTVNLDFTSVFSVVELHLANDLIDEDGNTVIRSLTLQPATPDNFDGALADGGSYDLETGVLTSDAALQAKAVEIDFGEAGVVLADAFTEVSLAVAPFTVPEGGMDVVIRDVSGGETAINILSEEADEGTALVAGEVLTQYLSRESDGIIPVNFPVVFPLGVTNDVRNFTSETQPRWVGEGLWTCPTQPQAYAQWHKTSDPVPAPTQYLARVNSGAISSPEIRGIWTGDYLEFVLPVKKFEAGSEVTVKLPMYTRQGPVFWDIEYLDGEQWKSNQTNVTCYDPAYTREATFSLVRGGKIIEDSMVFTNAIESGHVKVRIKCADGAIQAATDTQVAVRDTPWVNNSGAYGAPFYLYLAESDVTDVTFSIN